MQVWVVDDLTKGLLSSALRKVELDSEKLSQELAKLGDLLPQEPEKHDGTLRSWSMDQITLTFAVSAESDIQLVGAVPAAVPGGIQVTFKRRD